MRPFRFGVSMRSAGSRAEWVDKARKVEDLGFAVLSVPDHLAELPAPIPALIAAAQATSRLRVGTMVLNNDLRHPVVMAREAATLDLLSDGRLELGLGAGHTKSEYDQAGLTFDTGGIRVERLAEAAAIVKALLAGEPVSFSGRYYRVTEHKIHPLPVQRPRPPVLIGGNSPRVLALAAREADIVGLTGIAFRRDGAPPDLSAWRAAVVDQRLALVREAAGERSERLVLNALIQRVVVTDDRHAAARELASHWPQLTVEDVLETPYLLLGTVGQIIDDLRGRRERWGISYYTIFEPFIDALAPVVSRLTNT